MKYDEALMLSKELDVVMIPYELAEGMEQTKTDHGIRETGTVSRHLYRTGRRF